MPHHIGRSTLTIAVLACLLPCATAQARAQQVQEQEQQPQGQGQEQAQAHVQDQAQDEPVLAASTDQYPAAYFLHAAPANAQDMLVRVPGFTIVDADADVRGYAGAVGNVLIDGVRPASKRDSVSSVLKRIPAGSVERIELIRSGTPGIDMGGYAVLANVVRHADTSVESALQAGVIASTDGWVAPALQWEYGRRSGENALDLSVKIDPELDDDSGRGTILTSDADGTLHEEQQLDTRTIKHKGEANAAWRRPVASGQLTLTAGLRGEQARTDTLTWSTPAADDDERVNEDEDTREMELGARFVRQFDNHTTMELIAQQHLGWLEGSERSIEGDDSESFEKTNDTGESIGRVDVTHMVSHALSLNASLEGAFNFLESDSQLQENGVPTVLPGSDVRVEERRLEAAVGATWSPVPAWTFDAGIRLERSDIAQTGDTTMERSFTYPKPRLAARWDVNPGNQLRASLSREVGQLDFEDFAASASLDTDTVSAGNAELEPDQTWALSTEWEHTFNNEAALTLGWAHDRISDVVDRVLIVTDSDIYDAPGNIGDGTRDTISLDLSVPLDGIGFIGGRIRSTLLWRDSQVTDPVTGERRGISEEKPFEGEVELTQDLPQLHLNWGLLVEHIAEEETKYRYDEVKHESEAMGWTLYAERRLGEHWRLRAEATDLFGRGFDERREKYDGPRNVYPVDEVERRKRTTPGYFSLTLRRSMGG